MRVYTLVLVALIALGAPDSSDAWRDVGHMVTGEIARLTLSDEVRSKVEPAMQLFNEFDLQTSDPIATGSAWADLLKYDKFRAFDAWHFYDASYLWDGAKTAPAIPPTNALWALDQIKTTLSDGSVGGLFGQAYALRMALHIVGDIHQPLHAISRISPQHPEGDFGGNLFKVQNYVGLGDLHSFWDFGAGALQYPANMSRLDLYTPPGVVFIQSKALNISKAFPQSSFPTGMTTNTNFTYWQQESYEVAIKSVYTNFTDTEDWSTPHPVPASYQAKAMQIVMQRCALGGYRLANLLTDIYSKQKNPLHPIKPKSNDNTGPNLWFYIAAGVAGFLLIVLAVVLVTNKQRREALRDEERRSLINNERTASNV